MREVSEVLDTLVTALMLPLNMLVEPNKRLYWGHLLASLLFVCVVSGSKRWTHLRILFDRRIWWHPSSRADMQVIAINSLLRTLLVSASLLSATAVAAAVSLLLTRLVGGKLGWQASSGLILSLYAVLAFVLDDFARYYLHRLQHRWRWLWVFHQTHHSALVLTPLTLMRTHPVDIVSAQLRDALVFGILNGLFYFAWGGSISYGDIFEMQIFALLFNFLGANIRHSQVWLHYGPLEGILISPAAHQLHHSCEAEHFDKNFGVCLALWDRIGGSFLDPRSCTSSPGFGLKDSPLSHPRQSLLTLYFHPFRQLLQLRHEKRVARWGACNRHKLVGGSESLRDFSTPASPRSSLF